VTSGDHALSKYMGVTSESLWAYSKKYPFAKYLTTNTFRIDIEFESIFRILSQIHTLLDLIVGYFGWLYENGIK
jgi:hypothetical protein